MNSISGRRDFGECHEACGVFGIWNHPAAAKLTHAALYSLQHRGQESAGIAVTDGATLCYHRGMGLVVEVFTQEDIAALPGRAAIGHVRYSTTGSSCLANAQPLISVFRQRCLALAHNGNITNAQRLRSLLEQQGRIFQTTSDTEVIAHLLMCAENLTFVEGILARMCAVEGAYSIVLLTNDQLIALRDPHGIRPLVLGQLAGAFVVASETCALDAIGANFMRDIEPGEMVVLQEHGLSSERFAPRRPQALCTLEYIYFARPDSTIDGINVYTARKNLGRALARRHSTPADLVTGVPESGTPAAIGYAEEAGIPYETAFIKNKYIGRTFIQPDQVQREREVALKLNVVRDVVKGKRVVIVDDSLVRGTTSTYLVKRMRAASAKEVHMRIASPPVTHPCFYGIDTSDRRELIAAQQSISEIAQYIGVDSLVYLSVEEMLHALGVDEQQKQPFCNACFTGHYPIRVENGLQKLALQ